MQEIRKEQDLEYDPEASIFDLYHEEQIEKSPIIKGEPSYMNNKEVKELLSDFTWLVICGIVTVILMLILMWSCSSSPPIEEAAKEPVASVTNNDHIVAMVMPEPKEFTWYNHRWASDVQEWIGTVDSEDIDDSYILYHMYGMQYFKPYRSSDYFLFYYFN